METREILILARRIAKHLGAGWTAQAFRGRFSSSTNKVQLFGPTVERLDISALETSRYGAPPVSRLQFTGLFPNENGLFQSGLWGKRYAITVAPTRSAKVIARDIQNRLLAGYRPKLKERDALGRRQVSSFKTLLSGRKATIRGEHGSEISFYKSTILGHVKLFQTCDPEAAKMTDNYEVSLELRHIPLDKARKLLAVL